MMTIATLPEGYVLHAPKNHVLGPAVTIPADVSPSLYEQHEKTCANCGAVRVTMMGRPWRAWRRDASGPQIETVVAPPCDKDAPWPG